MPQMAPINWLMLFIIFFMTFIMFNMMNYYCFYNKMPQTPELSNTKLMNSMSWKW